MPLSFHPASNCAWKIMPSQLVPTGPASHTSQFWTKRLIAYSSEVTPCPFASSSRAPQSISTLFLDHLCSHLCHREGCPPRVFLLRSRSFLCWRRTPFSLNRGGVPVLLLLCRAGQRELEPTLGTQGFTLCANTYKISALWRQERVRNETCGVLLENGCLRMDRLFCCHPSGQWAQAWFTAQHMLWLIHLS